MGHLKQTMVPFLISGKETPGYYYFVVDGYHRYVGNFQLSVSVNNIVKSTGALEEPVSDKKDEKSLVSEIKIYPNPVKNELFVVLPIPYTQLKIIDMRSRILKAIQVQGNQHIVDCSDIDQGIDIIQIIFDDVVEIRIFEEL